MTDAANEYGAPPAGADQDSQKTGKFAQTADQVRATADQVRKTVTEGAGVARDWALDQSDVLRDTVQTKPFIAIGVSAASAFAAGLVLGILLTRR